MNFETIAFVAGTGFDAAHMTPDDLQELELKYLCRASQGTKNTSNIIEPEGDDFWPGHVRPPTPQEERGDTEFENKWSRARRRVLQQQKQAVERGNGKGAERTGGEKQSGGRVEGKERERTCH